MTDIKYISASDLSSGKTIDRLIHRKWPSVLCFFPGSVPTPEELKKENGKQFAPYLIIHIIKVIKKNNLFNPDVDFLDRNQQDLLNNTFPILKS